jgi:AraC family transcriptional regulator
MPDVGAVEAARTVEAEVATGICHARLVRTDWSGPIDVSGETVDHYLQLSLLPHARKGLACFPLLWDPRRFTPMGEMFFYPAGQLIHVKSECRRQQSITCSFDPPAVTKFLDDTVQWTEGRLVAGLDIAHAGIRSLLFRIGQEILMPGFASEVFVELMAGQVLIEVSRYIFNVGPADAGGGLSPWRMKLIDERLRDCASQPTLDELARLCKLSVRHLTRAFRTTRGRSIGEYIAEHRMERAKMLLSSGMAVKDVAQQMSFTSSNNFAAAFRRMTGECPREFMARTVR